VHYPQVSEIVKATAEEFGVPYLENETFGAAFKSHCNAIISFGKVPTLADLNEAIG
jgi:linoleoyl-CoA desaturase